MCVLSFVSKLKTNRRTFFDVSNSVRGRGLACHRPQPLSDAVVDGTPTASVVAGRGVRGGGRFPSCSTCIWIPFRFVDRTADAHPRLQRRVGASRQNSTTEINQTTPNEAASTMLLLPLSTKNPCTVLMSENLPPRKYIASLGSR